MTTFAGLHAHLTELARPWVQEKYARPAVRGIFAGTLDPAVMRHWLEQDYLYLVEYARSFARLAALAPDEHIVTLVDGAHYTLHDELRLHREIAADFGADLSIREMGPACRAYVEFLHTNCASYGPGVVAVLPCMMGFAALGLTVQIPEEPRYRRWVETYSSSDFQGYTRRFAAVVDGAAIEIDEAEAVFAAGMRLEIEFWDEAAAVIDPGASTTGGSA